MIEPEKVYKQEKVKYLKSKFIEKQAELFITDTELIIKSNSTKILGLNLFNASDKKLSLTKKKETVIPIQTISKVSFNPELNIIEFVNNKGKDFRIEFKKAEEWITMINRKIRIINN